MSEDEGSITCPDCGAVFDVAERLRAHIEAEIRNEYRAAEEKAVAEIMKTVEQDLKLKLDSIVREMEKQKAILEKRLSKQAKELTGDRETKLELTELKETIEEEE